MFKKISASVLSLFFSGCTLIAGTVGVVPLSSSEVKQAQAIALARQELIVKKNEAQMEFQTKMDRCNEEENGLNIQSQKLCFSVKKSHQLDPNVLYRLDEWKGQLVKQ